MSEGSGHSEDSRQSIESQDSPHGRVGVQSDPGNHPVELHLNEFEVKDADGHHDEEDGDADHLGEGVPH